VRQGLVVLSSESRIQQPLPRRCTPSLFVPLAVCFSSLRALTSAAEAGHQTATLRRSSSADEEAQKGEKTPWSCAAEGRISLAKLRLEVPRYSGVGCDTQPLVLLSIGVGGHRSHQTKMCVKRGRYLQTACFMKFRIQRCMQS
jgi:hypothetical protein